ncbi:MAG: hypothetical protein ACD_51C00048G0003 [uncultured bacterium]|nr:MAG: hypothetical protein ACD_51C00048G0003 [uncultured bacterium]
MHILVKTNFKLQNQKENIPSKKIKVAINVITNNIFLFFSILFVFLEPICITRHDHSLIIITVPFTGAFLLYVMSAKSQYGW